MNTNVLLAFLVFLCAINRAESNNNVPSSADSSVDSSSMGSDSVPIAVLQFDGDSHHHSRIVRERIVDDIYFGTETIPVYATETKFVYDYGPALYDFDASVTSTVYSTSTSIIINEWNQYTTTLRKRHHHRPCPGPIIPPYFPPDYYPYDPYDGFDFYDPYDDYYFDDGFDFIDDFVDDFVDDFIDDNFGRNNQPIQETTQIFHIKNECCPNNDNGNGNNGQLDFGENRGLIDNVIDILEPNGGEIIIDEQFNPNTGDLRELIEIIEPNNGNYFPNNNNGNYFPNNNNGNNFPNNNNGNLFPNNNNGNYFPNNNNGNLFPNNNNGNRGLIDNVIDIIEPNGGQIIIDEQFNPNTGDLRELIEIIEPNNGGIFNGNNGRSINGNNGIYYPNNNNGTFPIYNNGNRSANNISTPVRNLVEATGNLNYASLGIGGGNRSTGIFSGTVECTCDRQFPILQNLYNSRSNQTRSVYETNAGIEGTCQSSNYSSGGRSFPVAQSGTLENRTFEGRSNQAYVGEPIYSNGSSQPNIAGSNIAPRIQEVTAPQASTPATPPAQRQAPTAAKSAKTTPQPKPGQPRKPLLTSSSLSSSMLDSDFDEDFMFTSGADFSIQQGMKSAIFGLVIFAIVFVF